LAVQRRQQLGRLPAARIVPTRGTMTSIEARLRMVKILLTRHGHVEGIEPERFRGRADLALTRRGQAEAEAVAQRIATGWRPSMIFTSPLRRCLATGAMISNACKVDACALDTLNDIDYGEWQSRTYEEMRDANPEVFAAWFATPHLVRFPKGESLQDVVARTADALRFVLARHANETVILVGHDSSNRALLLQLLDQPLSSYWRVIQAPCCINEIDVIGGHVRVIRLNDTQHLAGIDVR
jgi:phosphoserine phosphatase